MPVGVAEEESSLALTRRQNQEWFAAVTAPWLEATEETTSAELTGDMWPRWPLYFAHPDAPAQRVHIARLRSDAVVAAGISRAWDEDHASGIDLTDRLGQISCPTLVLVGRPAWVYGPVWGPGDRRARARRADARLWGVRPRPRVRGAGSFRGRDRGMACGGRLISGRHALDTAFDLWP